MFRSINLVVVSLSLVGLLVASNAQADCNKYDVVGTTQLSPISLTPDGFVTFGMANWWEDDVYACYNAFLNPAYLFYFGACDFNGSGLVEIEEVLEIYNFVTAYPTGAVPAFAYECPTYECSAMPDFYDPSGSDVEWAANGICVELNGIDGPLACPQEQHNGVVADVNYILANYDFTNAVFEDVGGGGQSFNPDPYALICGISGGQAVFAEDTFADLNACYHANDKFLFDGALNNIEFDWGVNVEALIGEYIAVAQAAYGPDAFCELNGMIGGGPQGFHASDAGYGYTAYTVHATSTCDYYGCRCDATLTILSDGAGNYFVDSLVNDSIFDLFQGAKCEDVRFNF